MDELETISDTPTAVAWLLRAVGARPTGDPSADLELAAQATVRIRELNSKAGGMALEALSTGGGGHMSWREIRAMLGGPAVRTLRRWAEPPESPREG